MVAMAAVGPGLEDAVVGLAPEDASVSSGLEDAVLGYD